MCQLAHKVLNPREFDEVHKGILFKVDIEVKELDTRKTKSNRFGVIFTNRWQIYLSEYEYDVDNFKFISSHHMIVLGLVRF